MKQKDLTELMNNRNPLSAREPVIPADLYTSPQTDKTTNPQNDLPEKPQTDLPTKPEVDLSTKPQNDNSANDAVEIDVKSPQVHKTTSGQVDKRSKPQTDKTVKPRLEKYTTHLEPNTIRAIKLYALEHDLKDYQVTQKAIEKFLKNG